MRGFISLGSNLGDGPLTIRTALGRLDQQNAIQVVRCSSLYRTAPWGLPGQPDFTNAVADLETDLDPDALVAVLLDMELRLGRERGPVRWSPRIIDIDLLCCGQHISDRPELQLPHPRMHLRAFVLVPLLELEPDFVIPGIGLARTCLEKLDFQRVDRLE